MNLNWLNLECIFLSYSILSYLFKILYICRICSSNFFLDSCLIIRSVLCLLKIVHSPFLSCVLFWFFFPPCPTPTAPPGREHSYVLGLSGILWCLNTGKKLCSFLSPLPPLHKSWQLQRAFIQASFSTPQGRKPGSLNPE